MQGYFVTMPKAAEVTLTKAQKLQRVADVLKQTAKHTAITQGINLVAHYTTKMLDDNIKEELEVEYKQAIEEFTKQHQTEIIKRTPNEIKTITG